MTEDRITTIINELNYWKKNKMLPAVYCDFLLALYTNGEEIVDDKEAKRNLSFVKIGQLFLLILLLPFAFLVLYTSYFPNYIQLGILLLFLLYSFWQFKNSDLKQNFFYPFSVAVLVTLLLLTTVFISNTYVHINWFTQLVLIINFVFWFIIGRKMKLKYLSIVSVFGVLLLLLLFFVL